MEKTFAEGYQKALDLISECSTADGYLASPTERDNYRRIWARDGVIIGLAAFMTGDTDLAITFRSTLETLANRLNHLIWANYWFREDNAMPDDVYHEVLYRKGRKAACHCEERYWLPFFSPFGYGYRFDAFANVLASLLNVADDSRRHKVDTYIEDEVLGDGPALLPAFYPVITPVDEDWEHLQMTFSYNFKNKPYEFHNGGLWPMITGFYLADLARRGRTDRAHHYLDAIHTANAMEQDGTAWRFCEFIHGKDYVPGGTPRQCWNAAGAVIGQHALEGKPLFRINHE
jgi:hypothetical protein